MRHVENIVLIVYDICVLAKSWILWYKQHLTEIFGHGSTVKWKKLERVHKCITASLFELESDRLLQDGMFKQHEEQLQEKDCKLQSFLWCKVKVLSKSAISHAEMNMNWIWASYNSSVHHCGHCTIQPWLLSLRRAQRFVFEVSESIFEDVLGLLGVWRELGTGVAVNPEIGEKKLLGKSCC